MFRRTRITVCAALAAAALVPVGATPAHAMAACQAKSLGTHHHVGQFVAVFGAYSPANAVDVQMTCGVVQNGVTVARVTDALPGPVAVVADVQVIPGRSSVTSCQEITVTRLDGTTTITDTCP